MQHRMFALLLALFVLPLSAFAAPKDPPTAPLPAQILSAKKIFLAAGSNEVIAPTIPERHLYDQFYDSLKKQGGYELVSSPAEADLVLEIHNRIVAARSIPTKEGHDIYLQPQLSLIFRDPHTNTLLWTITEAYNLAVMDSNKRKDLDANLDLLLADFLRLTGAPMPAPARP